MAQAPRTTSDGLQPCTSSLAAVDGLARPRVPVEVEVLAGVPELPAELEPNHQASIGQAFERPAPPQHFSCQPSASSWPTPSVLEPSRSLGAVGDAVVGPEACMTTRLWTNQDLEMALAKLQRGVAASALSHAGEPVPVQLRLSAPLRLLCIAVPGEARELPLDLVQAVSIGADAHRVLEGRLPSRPPLGVCAVTLHDGNCLALALPAELSPLDFARTLCVVSKQGASTLVTPSWAPPSS